MPTVHEILKQSGLSDDQIASLDAKAMTAFNGVLSAAEQERKAAADAVIKAEQEKQAAAQYQTKAEQERAAAKAAQDAAELAQRSNVDFYETKIMPSLTGWEEQKAAIENARIKAEAEAAFYRAQNESAKAAGFVPTDAPNFTHDALPNGGNAQPRDNQGRYIPNAPGGTPGSPTFDPVQIASRIGDIAGTISDIQWKHQTLFGKPLPVAPSELIRQADAVKLSPYDYAARAYNFAAQEQALAQKAKEEEAAKIRAEAVAPYEAKLAEEKAAAAKAVAENDKKWAERLGNNPEVKLAVPSKFADVQRAVKAGERPDPLSMNESQRRQMTSQAIRSEIAESSVA